MQLLTPSQLLTLAPSLIGGQLIANEPLGTTVGPLREIRVNGARVRFVQNWVAECVKDTPGTERWEVIKRGPLTMYGYDGDEGVAELKPDGSIHIDILLAGLITLSPAGRTPVPLERITELPSIR